MKVVILLALCFWFNSSFSQMKWEGDYKVVYGNKSHAGVNDSKVIIELSKDSVLRSIGNFDWVFKVYDEGILIWSFSGFAYEKNDTLNMLMTEYNSDIGFFKDVKKYF